MVRRLGADRVVDYAQEDFTQDADAYDVVLDNIGNRTVTSYKRCLVDKGVLVVVGGPKGTVLAPIPTIAKTLVAFKFAASGDRSDEGQDRHHAVISQSDPDSIGRLSSAAHSRSEPS